MANEEVIEEVVEVEEKETENEETTEEIKEEKPQESPEARYARLKRQTEQAAKKLGLDVEKPKNTKKSDDLDYGQKAYLFANEIKGSDEVDLVKNIIKETGKTLEQVLESKYFKAELKEMRELKTTENAIPKGSKRTGQSAQDTVEYWLAKGELPKDTDLARKVVNARIEKETKKSVFYNS